MDPAGKGSDNEKGHRREEACLDLGIKAKEEAKSLVGEDIMGGFGVG